MPGAYTHITMANVASAPVELDKIATFPRGARRALGKWLKFCELGVVSPDYPYLDKLHGGSKEWADHMHYRHTDGVIKSAITQLRGKTGNAAEKGLAWLLGYTAHVVMDVTIHPVVNERVGDYAENATAHRICEMNQDVYIFQTRLAGQVLLSEHLDSGLKTCSNADGGLDDDIREIWAGALAATYPAEASSNAPGMDGWHKGFLLAVDKVAESGWLSAISRHVAPGLGLTYPKFEHVDRSFIDALPAVPKGTTIDFDPLFDKAKSNVHAIWTSVARGVLEGDDGYLRAIGSWNLDTGKDPAGNYVFW